MSIGYDVVIEGEEPGVIMNSAVGIVQEKTSRTTGYETEAESVCYRLPAQGKKKTGELYLPSEWFRAAILKTASNIWKVKLGNKQQYVKGWLAGTAFFEPEKIPLGITQYEVFVTSAIRGGGRVPIARPRIYPWAVKFKITFSDKDPLYGQLAQGLENIMRNLIQEAMIKVGVGDNRPGSPKKPGPHGRGIVKKCELFGV